METRSAAVSREAREGQEGVEYLRAEEDQEDHRGGLGGLLEAVDEALPGQGALRHADKEHGNGAQRGALGGGKDAAVDAADDDQGDQKDGPDGGQCAQPVADLDRRGGCKMRAPAHHDGDRDAVEDRGKKARDESGLEQLGDVLLGRDGIDDEDDGGRDEDAERAADGNGAGGKAGVVAVAGELGQRGAAEGGRRGDGGAADGAEGGAGPDDGHGEPAAHASGKHLGGLEQRGREARSLGQRPHQDEERNDGQRIVRKLIVRVRLHVGEERRPAREVDVAGSARD